MERTHLSRARASITRASASSVDDNKLEVDQDKLTTVAQRINAIYRDATLDVTFSIGQLVISELYEGNLDLWSDEGTRRLSYRKLASRGDLLLSPSALCRAVAIYVLCERLGGRAGWHHLTASHLQEVLVLDRIHQERILRAADEEHWSVARLRAEVTRHRPTAQHSRRSPLIQKVRRLKVFLAKQCITPEGVSVDDEQARELVDVVADLKQYLSTLEQLLTAHRNA